MLLIMTIVLSTSLSCKQDTKKSTTAEQETDINTDKQMIQDSLTNFGKRYAAAWSSKNPNDLASFYTTDGVLLDGDGTFVTGRDSIAYISKIFHDEIPDIVISLDSMVDTSNGVEFHWLLLGTNTRGIKVKMTGHEVMQIENGLITKSQGSYTNEEYARIVEEASKTKPNKK